MTYARPLKPIFFTDTINNNKLYGKPKSAMITDRSGSYNTGYDKYDLFDLNPQNEVSFDTSANTTTHILIQIDLGAFAFDVDYCALLNHNLVTAEGTIRIAHSATTISTAGAGTTIAALATPPNVILNGAANPDADSNLAEAIAIGETAWDVVDGTKYTTGEYLYLKNALDVEEVVKVTNVAANTLTVVRASLGTDAAHDSGDTIRRYNCVTPTADGDTLIDFSSSNDRYWAIEIIPSDGVFSATDLTMGSLMLGEKYSLPLSPDMNINHSFNFDGVSISTSLSGKKHSSPNWVKANLTTVSTGNYIPFRTNSGALQIPGREMWSLSYSTLTDTDILPSDLGTPTGNSFVVNVMSKTGWNALPFILGIDSTSTTQGDFMFGRFRDKTFNITQMSAQAYSTSFSIDQEF